MKKWDKKYLTVLLILLALITIAMIFAHRADAGVIKKAEWLADHEAYSRTINFIDVTGDYKCDYGTYVVVQNSIVVFNEVLTCDEAELKFEVWLDTHGKTGYLPADEF